MKLKNNQVIIYETADDQASLDVIFQDETVWLTQAQMAELFQKGQSTINEHIRNVYMEKELRKELTLRKFGNSENRMVKPTNSGNSRGIVSRRSMV